MMSRPRFKKNQEFPTPGSTYIFIALLIGIFYLFYLIIRPFLADLFVATVIALVFYPFYKMLLRVFRGRRILSALLTIFLIFLVFLVPISLLSGVVTTQSLDLYQKISSGLKNGSFSNLIDLKFSHLPAFLERWNIDVSSIRLEEMVGKILTMFTNFIYKEMAALAKGIVGVILNLIIVMFICFFLLIDGEKFLKEIRILSPLEPHHHDRILDQFSRTLKATLRGSLVVALAQGALGGLGFWIFNIPSAAFWGVCMVFSSVIPLVGTGIIWVPAAVYLFFSSSIWMGIGLALWGTVIVAGVDNVLRPLVLMEAANLHPLLTFLSVLGGLIYFGFLGFILGPIVLSILITMFDIYKTEFLTDEP
jgi:predicted PurR-regulated permease PerM